MRILVFEFITGGGFNQQSLPDSLVQEGELMRVALLLDLLEIPAIEIRLLHDQRLPLNKSLLENQLIEIIPVAARQDFWQILAEQASWSDAVWPIAPESEGVLAAISHWVQYSGLKLLGSSSEAVALTADKYRLYKHLDYYGVPVVKSYTCEELSLLPSGPWILKPRDGVGCEGVCKINLKADFKSLKNAEKFIIQPFEQGKSLSLSCLFMDGQGLLLCINEQWIKQAEGAFSLARITVNVGQEAADFTRLVAQVAKVVPGLWGYVGIDLIVGEAGFKVLEINPRLTTSYAGIRAALGGNLGASIVAMLTGAMNYTAQYDQSVIVEIPQEEK